MAFGLFLVYFAFSFIRPFELFPQLAQYNLMMGLGISTLALGVLSRFQAGSAIFRNVQLRLVAAFVAWAMLSVVLGQRWLGGAPAVFTRLSASLFIFYLMVFCVDRLDRLRTTLRLLVVLAVGLAVEGILAYHTGYRGDELIVREGVATASTGDLLGSGSWADKTVVPRIRSRGFLNDPNDLAQALICVLPFVFALRPRGSGPWSRAWVVVPGSLMLYAVFLTRSRGGLLSLGALAFLALRERLPATVSLGLAGAGGAALLALGALGGRATSIDASAEARGDAWRAGWQMLKSSPVWGVGFDFFTDYHEKVAHNSFVHCFSELGLVGYFIWLSILWIALRSTLSLSSIEQENSSEDEIKRLSRAAFFSLCAFLVAAFFLSRTYATALFVLVGIATTLADLSRRRRIPRWRVTSATWKQVSAILVASVLFVYLVIRVAP